MRTCKAGTALDLGTKFDSMKIYEFFFFSEKFHSFEFGLELFCEDTKQGSLVLVWCPHHTTKAFCEVL
jgi:hypothetical protein